MRSSNSCRPITKTHLPLPSTAILSGADLSNNRWSEKQKISGAGGRSAIAGSRSLEFWRDK